MPARATDRRLSRSLLLAACMAALTLLLLAAGATASSLSRRSSACTSRTVRRSSHPRRCVTQRQSRKVKGKAKHKGKKTTHKTGSSVATRLTAATCEDGSLPSRSSSGSYSCDDGSEPACENGAAPVRAHGTGSPMCAVEAESGGSGSETGGSECEAEGNCSGEPGCEESCEAAGGEEAGSETGQVSQDAMASAASAAKRRY